jgi:hypothetical protein
VVSDPAGGPVRRARRRRAALFSDSLSLSDSLAVAELFLLTDSVLVADSLPVTFARLNAIPTGSRRADGVLLTATPQNPAPQWIAHHHIATNRGLSWQSANSKQRHKSIKKSRLHSLFERRTRFIGSLELLACP